MTTTETTLNASKLEDTYALSYNAGYYISPLDGRYFVAVVLDGFTPRARVLIVRPFTALKMCAWLFRLALKGLLFRK